MGRATRGDFRLGLRPGLDGLRGIAIPLIVLYHFAVILWRDADTWLITGSYTSLDLFFALSGFLITCLLVAEFDRTGRIDLLDFAKRRASRLYPALAIVVGVVFLAAFTGFGTHRPMGVLRGSFWHLTFLHNGKALVGELGQTWSLGVEAQFYLLWSVTVAVVVATFRRGRAVLATLAAAVVVFVVVTRTMAFDDAQQPVSVYIATRYRIDGPLVGAIAGVAYASGWLSWVSRRLAAQLAAAGLIYLGLVSVFSTPFDSYQVNWAGYTINAVVGAAVVVSTVTLADGRLLRGLSSRPLVYLGRISYGLFLWHMPIFHYLAKHGGTWPVAIKAVVGFGATFALSALSYRFIESPFLRRGRSRRRADRVPLVASPAGGAGPAIQEGSWGASKRTPRQPNLNQQGPNGASSTDQPPDQGTAKPISTG